MSKSVKRNRLIINATIFIVYLLISLAYFGFPTLNSPQTRYVGMNADPTLFIWFIEWWPFAIIHHLNPFVTAYMWAPEGVKNLLWLNAIPGLSIIFSPLTVLVGPVFTYNVIALLNPALSAFFAYILIKYITKNTPASAISAYIYGFSSYIMGNSDMNVFFICLIPLIVYIFLLKYDDKINTALYIIISAAILAFEFLISPEIYLIILFLAIISILIYILFIIKNKKNEYLSKFIIDSSYFILSYVLSIALISPFLFIMLESVSKSPKYPMNPISWSTYIINLILPGPVIFFGGKLFYETFHFRIRETASYLGIPIFIVLILFAYEQWKKKSKFFTGKYLLTLLAVILIFSLGPFLHLNGNNTNIPLPWYIFYKMPLIGKAIPIRFMLFAFLILSIVAALWISSPNSSSTLNKTTKYIILFLAIISFIPNQFYFDSNSHMPHFFYKKEYKRYIKKNSNVLIIPFSNSGYSLLYQAYTKNYFKLAGGYNDIAFIPSSYSNSLIFKHLTYNKKFRNINLKKNLKTANLFKKFLRNHKINYIIVVRRRDAYIPGYGSYHPFKRFKNILNTLNIKPVKKGGILLYKIIN